MLTHVTAADVADFTRACSYEHVFGSKILTTLRTHGLGDPKTRFFLCRKGREPAAALCLLDGVLSISSDERADPAAIAALIKQEDVREVNTNRHQCEALHKALGGTMKSSYYMVYRGAQLTEDPSGFVRGDLKTVFDILQRSHEYYRTQLSFPSWSEELQAKLSRGLAELYQLECDGEVVGTGCIVSEDDECGVIGAVAVLPAHRHKGLGSRISRLLVQRIQEKGKMPRLISGYDEVTELYCRIGFAPCGRWGELYL